MSSTRKRSRHARPISRRRRAGDRGEHRGDEENAVGAHSGIPGSFCSIAVP